MGMRLTFGFEIDNILGHVINEEKAARDFANFDDKSLNKIMTYSIAIPTQLRSVGEKMSVITVPLLNL